MQNASKALKSQTLSNITQAFAATRRHGRPDSIHRKSVDRANSRRGCNWNEKVGGDGDAGLRTEQGARPRKAFHNAVKRHEAHD